MFLHQIKHYHRNNQRSRAVFHGLKHAYLACINQQDHQMKTDDKSLHNYLHSKGELVTTQSKLVTQRVCDLQNYLHLHYDWRHHHSKYRQRLHGHPKL